MEEERRTYLKNKLHVVLPLALLFELGFTAGFWYWSTSKASWACALSLGIFFVLCAFTVALSVVLQRKTLQSTSFFTLLAFASVMFGFFLIGVFFFHWALVVVASVLFLASFVWMLSMIMYPDDRGWRIAFVAWTLDSRVFFVFLTGLRALSVISTRFVESVMSIFIATNMNLQSSPPVPVIIVVVFILCGFGFDRLPGGIDVMSVGNDYFNVTVYERFFLSRWVLILLVELGQCVMATIIMSCVSNAGACSSISLDSWLMNAFLVLILIKSGLKTCLAWFILSLKLFPDYFSVIFKCLYGKEWRYRQTEDSTPSEQRIIHASSCKVRLLNRA